MKCYCCTNIAIAAQTLSLLLTNSSTIVTVHNYAMQRTVGVGLGPGELHYKMTDHNWPQLTADKPLRHWMTYIMCSRYEQIAVSCVLDARSCHVPTSRLIFQLWVILLFEDVFMSFLIVLHRVMRVQCDCEYIHIAPQQYKMTTHRSWLNDIKLITLYIALEVGTNRACCIQHTAIWMQLPHY